MARHPEMQICLRHGRKRMSPSLDLSGQRAVRELIRARNIYLHVPDPGLTAHSPASKNLPERVRSAVMLSGYIICPRHSQTRTLRRAPMSKKSQQFPEDIGHFSHKFRRMRGVRRRATRAVSANSPAAWETRAEAEAFQSTLDLS